MRGQIRRQRLDPLCHPVDLLAQPLELTTQPDQHDQR